MQSTKNVTAENLLNKNERDNIRKLDEGYHIYRSLRNSPPYFEKFKKDVLAMVRQLGIPTLFFLYHQQIQVGYHYCSV